MKETTQGNWYKWIWIDGEYIHFDAVASVRVYEDQIEFIGTSGGAITIISKETDGFASLAKWLKGRRVVRFDSKSDYEVSIADRPAKRGRPASKKVRSVGRPPKKQRVKPPIAETSTEPIGLSQYDNPLDALFVKRPIEDEVK
jgi:hypothetical protein